MGSPPSSDGNVTLTAANVGARANTWMPTAAQVGAIPDANGSVTNANLANSSVGTSKLIDASVTAAKITPKAIVPFSYTMAVSQSKWVLNDYGLYEQTVTLDMSSTVAPDTHIGLLGHTRGLMHYPGDGSTSWGWSQTYIKNDKKKLACLYSAKIIAENTVKFVATKVPDGSLYITIIFIRR